LDHFKACVARRLANQSCGNDSEPERNQERPIDKYQDEYKHALLDLINKKVEAGGELTGPVPDGKRKTTNVIDLVSVLQESLQHAGKSGRNTRKTTKQKKHHHLKKAA
jgi:non-homologous end joining protein Ku